MATEAQTKITPISKSPYSKEGLVKRLNEFRTRYNRYPTRKDFSEKKIEPSKNAYYRIFGDKQRAVDAAEEQWIKDRFPPKNRRKSLVAKQPSGFECPFCGNLTRGSSKFHAYVTNIIISRFIALTESDSGNSYPDGIFACVYSIFGPENILIQDALRKEGFLGTYNSWEIYNGLNNAIERKIVCDFFKNKLKKSWEPKKSSLTTILIMRFMDLLKSNKGQNFFDAVMDCTYSIFKGNNQSVREALELAGYLEAFEQRHGTGEQDQEYKLQCAYCSEWKWDWLITIDDSIVARYICEDCLASSKTGER